MEIKVELRRALTRIAAFFSQSRKTAQQLTALQRWYRILSQALVKYLRGRKLATPAATSRRRQLWLNASPKSVALTHGFRFNNLPHDNSAQEADSTAFGVCPKSNLCGSPEGYLGVNGTAWLDAGGLDARRNAVEAPSGAAGSADTIWRAVGKFRSKKWLRQNLRPARTLHVSLGANVK
jgi:hypothetical protein